MISTRNPLISARLGLWFFNQNARSKFWVELQQHRRTESMNLLQIVRHVFRTAATEQKHEKVAWFPPSINHRPSGSWEYSIELTRQKFNGLGFRIHLERYLGHCTSTEGREPNSEIIKDGVMMEADGAWLVIIQSREVASWFCSATHADKGALYDRKEIPIEELGSVVCCRV